MNDLEHKIQEEALLRQYHDNALTRICNRLQSSTRNLWILNGLLLIALLAVAICLVVYAYKEMQVVGNLKTVVEQIVEYINGGAG